MTKNLVSSRPYTSAEIIADIETEIKLLIKNTIFRVTEWGKYQKAVDDIIEAGLKDITNEGLADIIRRTSKRFANIEFEKLVKYLDFGNLPLIVGLAGAMVDLTGWQDRVNDYVDIMPMRRIETGFSNLASSTPKVENRQSLYGYAEMYERYETNKAMVAELRGKTSLVICDTHSNCSDRCFVWQGRVFSLDGTYGITSDGRRYVPLEVATQARDKYGNINGLLGYNCRHKLIEYNDGVKPPTVTKEEQKKQYAINMEQRAYENDIRAYKQRAELSIIKSDKDRYKDKIKELTSDYKQFCKNYGVVEYRSRLKI